MNRILVAFCLVILVIALVPVPAVSQTQPEMKSSGGPPAILTIGREEVKPGKGAAHEKLESVWTQAFAKANWPNHFLALTAMTGPSEVWFLSGFPNYEALQNDMELLSNKPSLQAEDERFAAQEDQFLAGQRRWILEYRSDLSYRPDTNIGEFHNVVVDVVRLKPGHGSKFADLRKTINAAHEKANLDEHMVVYQVVSGAPMGTYVIFMPIKSVKIADVNRKTHDKGSELYNAMGDEGRKQVEEFNLNSVANYDRIWFAMSPSMSYVSKEVAAADPAFWTPKPAKPTKPVEAKMTKPKQ